MDYIDAHAGAADPCPPSLTLAPGPRRFLFPEEALREGALLGLEPGRGAPGDPEEPASGALCLLSTAVVSSSGGTGYSSAGGLCLAGGGSYSGSLGYGSGGGFSSTSSRSMGGSSSSMRVISKTASTKKSYRS